MKYLFFVLVGVTLFFSLSVGQITPAIVVNHGKFAHFLVFLVLSFCMNISFPTHTIKDLIVGMISLALGIEFVQYLFANRELSVIDIGASMAGIFVYVTMLKVMVKKYKIVEKIFGIF